MMFDPMEWYGDDPTGTDDEPSPIDCVECDWKGDTWCIDSNKTRTEHGGTTLVWVCPKCNRENSLDTSGPEGY